jgi:ribosomal protein S4
MVYTKKQLWYNSRQTKNEGHIPQQYRKTIKKRLDTLLVELDLCSSRQLAQRLIRAGEVTVNQQVIDKPGTEVETFAHSD